MSFDWGGFTGSIVGVLGAIGVARWTFKKEIERDKEQRIEERDAELRAARRVASIIEKRMEVICKELNKIADQAQYRPFINIPIEKGVPDDLILRAFDNDLVTKLYVVWSDVDFFQKELKLYTIPTNAQIEQFRSKARPILQEFHATWLDLRKFAYEETTVK